MKFSSKLKGEKQPRTYLSSLGAWALAFGCSVGWGAFVMPGGTFLPIAGPLGTVLGIVLGAITMLVIGANYHLLMNRFSGGGGAYTYTKHCFGYDHGFLSSWFLALVYLAVAWANATALPLIARAVLGNVFQFGFDYEIAGYHLYFGEIVLAVGALLMAAAFCLHRKLAVRVQIVMAFLLLFGIVVCFIAALRYGHGGLSTIKPAFSPEYTSLGGTITIFALAPWAFVGFESISHSTGEARYSQKKTFLIMFLALLAAGLSYSLLAVLGAMIQPEGCASWTDYIMNLDSFEGITSMPTFYAAYRSMGQTGSFILGLAALGGILTGVIGNYIALSRLIVSMAEDDMLPVWLGKLDDNYVPRNAIFFITSISVILPFFGRTAIGWIVDVTTIGATIAYAITSAAALKVAKEENNKTFTITGVLGIVISFVFFIEFLVPNMTSVKTLSTESYLILAAWGILGFIYFRYILKRDKERRLGHSTLAWIVLLGLIIFTSTIWMRQTTESSIEKSEDTIAAYFQEHSADDEGTAEFLSDILQDTNRSLDMSCLIQIGLIVVALIILFDIYSRIQKREKQIEVEKILAEESSRAKTSFLSNMSHEIRTPMNAIIGLDNIALRNPDLPAKTREHLEKIGISARHLLGLINDILDMSRIESGRMVLKNDEFSFREFIDQINIIINGQCQDKGLNYECRFIGHLNDYYIGDDMKLKQVLINILGNSVKFTDPPGDVSLTVEQTRQFEDYCTLSFAMKDTGIGMDQEYIPKIFEAFSQEHATTVNTYGGSGLGMAITKNFVEMMNGEIRVESKKGVGSTFTVTVTLKSSSRSIRDDHGIVLPEGLRAMVIDDDEISCEHTLSVLQAIGIESDTMCDSKEGLDLIRLAHDNEQPYGLIITDYKMPVMNGLDLTRAVREFDGNKTAVIMLTGYNWDIIEEEAREAGVDDIMAKPLFSDTLSRKIHSVFRTKEGTDYTVSDPEEATEARPNNLAGCMILMAEDVDQNAEILEDLLDLEEIDSERAENGARALEMFSEKPEGYYDAILMDVRMPVMDGLAATKAIRALERPDAKTIPIIAMTANVFDEDVERSLQAGMNAHLSKPIEPEYLYETMERLIKE